MTLRKRSVQTIDLDDFERQLREVAESFVPRKHDDPLAELSEIIGRRDSLRAIPGGLDRRAPSLGNDVASAEATSGAAEPEAPPLAPDFADETAGEAIVDDVPPHPDEAEDDHLPHLDPPAADGSAHGPGFDRHVDWDDHGETDDGLPAFDEPVPVPTRPAASGLTRRSEAIGRRGLAVVVVLCVLVLGGAVVMFVARTLPGKDANANSKPVMVADTQPGPAPGGNVPLAANPVADKPPTGAMLADAGGDGSARTTALEAMLPKAPPAPNPAPAPAPAGPAPSPATGPQPQAAPQPGEAASDAPLEAKAVIDPVAPLPPRRADAGRQATLDPAPSHAGPAAGLVSPGISVKLASSTTETDAKLTLERLRKQFPGALDGATIRKENQPGEGTFYRVRLGGLSRAAAAKLCARLKAGGRSCSTGD